MSMKCGFEKKLDELYSEIENIKIHKGKEILDLKSEVKKE